MTQVARRRPRNISEQVPRMLVKKTVTPNATGFEHWNFPWKKSTTRSKKGVMATATLIRMGRIAVPIVK